MNVGIMQPYFFPYVGYFQLMRCVDTFVILDDVNFIKRGWINRNRILVNDEASYLTVPVVRSSQNRPINQTGVVPDQQWKRKLLKSVSLAYRNTPSFDDVFPLVENCIGPETTYISELALHSIKAVMSYLGLDTRLVETSSIYDNDHLRGEERIIDICRCEHATAYVNLPGGRDLYDPEEFRQHGIALRFLEPGAIRYRQHGKPFVPWLSIIDVLMFNTREEALELLQCCSLQDA